MEAPLMPEYDEDTDEETLLDEEAGAYSNFGGRLSGKGMAYDPPDVANAMIKSFQNHPEVLSTYVQGRVVNGPQPPLQDFQSGQKTGWGAIDYGGSMNSFSHSVNGHLVVHDDSFPHEFHIM